MTPGRKAFSLLELLAVMTIATLLLSLAIPAVSSLSQSFQLSRAGRAAADTLSLARQTAMTRNKCVAMRFFRPESEDSFTGFQAYILHEDASEEPVGKLYRMPDGVIFSANSQLSNLLQQSSGTATLPTGEKMDYVEFQFRRDGGTDLDPFSPWYLSITSRRDAEQPVPGNYLTFLIEADNGKVKIYRP